MTGKKRKTVMTETLLLGGVIAGPVYVLVALGQIVFRRGFDPSRDAVSLLSNGALGWIQITSFEVTGLLSLAAAAGMRRALRPGPAGLLGPLLVGGYGVGLVAAGMFVDDPTADFPPRPSGGAPPAPTWHGGLHGVAATVTFLSLLLACLVFAGRFTALRRWGWAALSGVAAALYAAAWLALERWHGHNAIPALYLAVAFGWLWLSMVSARLRWNRAGAMAAR